MNSSGHQSESNSFHSQQDRAESLGSISSRTSSWIHTPSQDPSIETIERTFNNEQNKASLQSSISGDTAASCHPSSLPKSESSISTHDVCLSGSLRRPFRSILSRLRREVNNGSQAVATYTPMLLLLCYYVGSTAMYTVCNSKAFEVLWYVYMISNAYIAFSVVLETFLSFAPWRESQKVKQIREHSNWIFPVKDQDLPLLDICVVAYLPNEQLIIEDRALYLLEQLLLPKDRYRVNILYNTPETIEPLETRLHDLVYDFPNVRIIKVPNSSSKADNINFFLSLGFESDLVAIYDCDHYPHPYSPRFALERFKQDPKIDIVQGRCVVLNTKESWLSSMIAAEFDRIYAVSHPGRAALWGFGLFCGSNGYWRTSLLRQVKMDQNMLTEDIDSALRALNLGARVVHDLNVVSYELAPTRLAVLFKQRLRWAQGWFHVSLKHVRLAWKSTNIKPRLRAGIVSLLLIREISYYLVTQYCCFVLALLITGFPKTPYEVGRLLFFTFPLSQWLFLISVICFIITLSFTFIVRSEFISFWRVLGFTIMYPLYLILVATLGLYSHARHFCGYSAWNPTART